MSVIGRLDEQVDAVLIRPLSKRGQHQEDKAAQDARSPDRAEPSSEKKSIAPANVKEMSDQESPPERDELPVWLL